MCDVSESHRLLCVCLQVFGFIATFLMAVNLWTSYSVACGSYPTGTSDPVFIISSSFHNVSVAINVQFRSQCVSFWTLHLLKTKKRLVWCSVLNVLEYDCFPWVIPFCSSMLQFRGKYWLFTSCNLFDNYNWELPAVSVRFSRYSINANSANELLKRNWKAKYLDFFQHWSNCVSQETW